MKARHRRLCALLLALALAAPSPLPWTAARQAQAQDAPGADPEALFEEGIRLFSAQQYAQAAEVFRQVFVLDPNPFVLFNIGRCYEEMGDTEAALRYYQRSLALDGLPTDARLDALMRLEQLEPMIQRQKLTGALQMAYGGARLAQVSATREADLQGRAWLEAHAPKPEPKPEPKPAPKPLPPPPPPPARGMTSWAGLGSMGLGLASLGIGISLYVQVSQDLDEHSNLRQEYNSLRQDALAGDAALAPQALRVRQDANELAGEIEDNQLLSGLFLGLGTLFTLGGAALFVLDSPSLRTEQSPEEAGSLRLQLAPNGVQLQGHW